MSVHDGYLSMVGAVSELLKPALQLYTSSSSVIVMNGSVLLMGLSSWFLTGAVCDEAGAGQHALEAQPGA